MTETIEPSLWSNSFNCPHCGSHAHQNWYQGRGGKIYGIPPQSYTERYFHSTNEIKSKPAQQSQLIAEQARLSELANLENSGFLYSDDKLESFQSVEVLNLSISKCFTCKKMSLWIKNSLLYPSKLMAEAPNPDIPEDIRKDVDEARSIINQSPRGAAALLRLALQKLCHHLDCDPKDDLNTNIADLVKNGLPLRVQQSLDIVRVIGNEAVHPGSIDIKDDRETANTLVNLINIISDIMISQPKHIEATYERLPKEKREAITKRDKKP